MHKLFLLVFIAFVTTTCKQDDPLPPGASNSFVKDEMVLLNDSSWVYDSINHVYNAKATADILDDYAISHYEVRVGLGTYGSANFLPYEMDSVMYTSTYKELEVDLKATPMSDSASVQLASSFVVFLFK